VPQSLTTRSEHRKRSRAWVYYALITVMAIAAGFNVPLLFLVVPVTGLYARYLYRGGRFVIWFW
jgi:hypothetical protein